MARRRSPEDEEFYLQLGRRIEAARKRKGWSADQLAQEAGIRNRAQVYRYESGENAIPAPALARIAAVLQVSVIDLLHPGLIHEWILTRV
jgi:transcriptional regulator with XRE-family HTH domain